jgi:hypothetical protein
MLWSVRASLSSDTTPSVTKARRLNLEHGWDATVDDMLGDVVFPLGDEKPPN